MKLLTTNEIRKMWLEFFKSKNHHFLPPVSLIPVDDPSLLWINSGVATLKPYFDGRKTPPAPRLTNSQKAIRTNDIENVGLTARHHTMFEMLGNFSIGDYFKKEAIEFAWELLTSEQWFAIDKEKLYITVFDEDQEAYEIWIKEIKIADDHIFKMNRDTNFWDVGQGPCGPNTEIFFDRGEEWDKEKIGTKLLSEDIENDRYIEIWNIVFSQFNNDGHDNYAELPRKNIDTGAGLERIASIFQNTPTNFETDIFWPTILQTQKLCNPKFKYSIENYNNPKPEQTKINTSFKIIADHIRATTFAIADGVFPGNKERGYIIRRLIRRALIKGLNLQINGAFLYSLVDYVIMAMSDFYPYLNEKKQLIVEAIRTEEEKFLSTLSKGYETLQKLINTEALITGENALLLFESYGYPIELTIEIAQENNKTVDLKAFEKLFEMKKQLARDSRKDLKAWDKQNELFTKLSVESTFTGWEEISHLKSKVIFMFDENGETKHAKDQEVFVILDKTPFYAEKGGQAADFGIFIKEGKESKVIDVQQGPNHQNIHRLLLNGELKTDDLIDAFVDKNKRVLTMKNHSGTHLIHAALRAVLGDSVMQSGSFNNEDGLRMDFTYNKPISEQELQAAQDLVNQKINMHIPREVYFCTMNEAINKYHALAFFTEKYDDIVRVVRFSDFSSELCGGTHVANTIDIEQLMITGIESKGSGVYRVKCLTSYETIKNYIKNEFEKYFSIADELFFAYDEKTLKDNELDDLYKKIKAFKINEFNLKMIKKSIDDLKAKMKLYLKKSEQLNSQLRLSKYKETKPIIKEGINYIDLHTSGLEISDLKILVDEFKNKYEKLIIKLESNINSQKFIVIGVSQDLHATHKAIEIFNNLNPKPKGGGNASLAQGKYF